MKTIGWHLGQIKEIQEGLNEMYQQAVTNLDAMHQFCGGNLDEKGNYIMDRDRSILWFANEKHKSNYATPDDL